MLIIIIYLFFSGKAVKQVELTSLTTEEAATGKGMYVCMITILYYIVLYYIILYYTIHITTVIIVI